MFVAFVTLFLVLFSASTVRCGPCPLDFVAYKKQGCFYYKGYPQEILSRDEAKIACYAKQRSNLASIDDAEQEAWLANDFMNKNDTVAWTAWIGLIRDELQRRVWRWDDNSTSTYTHWGRGEPNDYRGLESCTMMFLKYNPNGSYWFSWNDAVCEPPSSSVRNLQHTKAAGYFCRLPYKEQPPIDAIDTTDQNAQQDMAVFNTNVGLAVSGVILLTVILSLVGYVTWTYRSKMQRLTTKLGSTEVLTHDHE